MHSAGEELLRYLLLGSPEVHCAKYTMPTQLIIHKIFAILNALFSKVVTSQKLVPGNFDKNLNENAKSSCISGIL